MHASLLMLAIAASSTPPAEPLSRASGPVYVAAAADLKFALDEVVAQFRKTTPAVEVRTSFGSSGSFFAQISNGAPMDVFLSADARYPRKLVEAGAAVRGTEFVYAIGRIVLWVPKSSPLDLDKLGMKALADPSVKRIAIANPDHAPYGIAAVQAMRAAGVHDEIRPKLILGQNIAQAAQFVQSGNAEVGVLAISLAKAPTLANDGRYWLVGTANYERMEQAGVLLTSARNPAASRAFIAYLQGAEARSIMERYGFVLPK
jgi:molybdate transport system substrate-binding protein